VRNVGRLKGVACGYTGGPSRHRGVRACPTSRAHFRALPCAVQRDIGAGGGRGGHGSDHAGDPIASSMALPTPRTARRSASCGWRTHQDVMSEHIQASASSASAGDEGSFVVTLSLEDGYRFAVDPGIAGAEAFHVDEPPPLGAGSAASPSRVLAAAMASCLGSSLLFCLRKARIDVRSLRVQARGTMVRNARGRLRVGGLHLELFPEVTAADEQRMQRCLEIFEDFCVVTESVRQGIPVVVGVETRTT
jgi:organic hydroperoxide reductase OsmC/OhrA